METTITKNYAGKYEAETLIELPELPAREDMGELRRPVLVISSAGARGGIQPIATVFWCLPTSRQWTMCEDFSKRLPLVPCARVTEKAIAQAHQQALEQADALKAEAITHYENMEA